MLSRDAAEAAEIVQRNIDALNGLVIGKGRAGSSLRHACGALRANAETLIREARVAEPWMACYTLAREAGATWRQVLGIRRDLAAEDASSLVATIIKSHGLLFSLITASRILVNDEGFRSRQDVDAAKAVISSAFSDTEELIADDMQADIYQAVIALRASTIAYLVERQRPLPRMLRFSFGSPKPSLWFAHRLYADAGRADEMRAENKVVHPAFMRPSGQALSN